MTLTISGRYDDGEREEGQFDFEANVFFVEDGQRALEWLTGRRST
jgi:hypothetical protein